MIPPSEAWSFRINKHMGYPPEVEVWCGMQHWAFVETIDRPFDNLPLEVFLAARVFAGFGL